MNVSEQLIKAAKSGNIKDVKKLLSKGALFTKDEFGNTALHEAAWTGNNDIVKLLLKSGCFVDSVNGAGFTPLHLSSQNGHAKATKTLLKWKANASIRNQHEEAPIHLVAKYDHAHIVPLFAAAKVDLDIKAKDGNTALHIAAKLGYISTVKTLIQSGANPNHTNMKKKLPIDYAEIGDYHDTVKILIPLTERPAVIGRRATLSGRSTSPRSKAPDTESLHSSHYKKPFFNRSPRSFKSPKTSKKKSADSPHSLHEVDLRMRYRSSSTVSPAMRRYSKEFEDLPTRLFSYSSSPNTGSANTSPLIRSQRSATKSQSPSLDDLLEEIEKESSGPDYKYVPQQSDDSEDNSSVTYKPLQRISVKSIPSSETTTPNINSARNLANSFNFSLPNLAVSTPRSSAVLTPSPLLRTSNPIYDYLTPRGTTKNKEENNKEEDENKKEDNTTSNKNDSPLKTSDDNTSTDPSPHISIPKSDSGDSYVCLSPPGASDKRTSPDGQDDSVYSHPVLSDDVLHHRYEYLPPLPSEEQDVLKEGDFESYVYMAPRTDSHLPPKNVAGNGSSSHLGSSSSSPALRRGISSSESSQTSNDANKRLSIQSDTSSCSSSIFVPPPPLPQRNSQLERYLEEELDTIRQAFQIRLSQMEKRYERKLHSLSSSSPLQSRTNSYADSPPNSRCSSWHTEVNLTTPLGQTSWSASKDSLSGTVTNSNGCHSNGCHNNVSTGQNFSQVADCNGMIERPKMSDFMMIGGNDHLLNNEGGEMVHDKMKEYKSKMMEYLMERAEQQMVTMERDYERRLQEKLRQKSISSISPKLNQKSETFV